MNKNSTLLFKAAQRVAGGGIATRTGLGNGLTRANERADTFASVAIDGYCARKNAERMSVREKSGLEKVNLGGTAVVFDYRPEA